MTIEKLSKSYGSKNVLQEINLDLEKGKVYGIVGENGSGKTTLFRCMAGLEKYEGHINAKETALKNVTGFLPTDPYFFSKITGREYIRLLTQARDIRVKDVDEKNIFKLPLDQYATAYSTGMKKKLALTAILLQENKFFILDEPFNGVDIASNILLTEIIHRLKTLGKTVVISSHIFSTLNDTCDEILLLHDGKIVRKAHKHEFADVEQEMKNMVVGSTIVRLGLK